MKTQIWRKKWMPLNEHNFHEWWQWSFNHCAIIILYQNLFSAPRFCSNLDKKNKNRGVQPLRPFTSERVKLQDKHVFCLSKSQFKSSGWSSSLLKWEGTPMLISTSWQDRRLHTCHIYSMMSQKLSKAKIITITSWFWYVSHAKA